MSTDPQIKNRSRNSQLVLPLMFWALVGAVSIGLHGPMPLYSTRTLGVAWEMWCRGEFLVPYLNGDPYSQKPPLLYWLIDAGWAVGGVGDVWPRVLMVLISTGWLASVGAIASKLFPGRPFIGRRALWVLAALPVSFLFSLQIMFEVLLALWVVLALLAIAPSSSGERPRWRLFGLALGAGLLTKGPIMFLHVGFVALAGPWWSTCAQQEPGRWYRGALLGLAIGLALLLAWLVPALLLGGARYRADLLWMQTAGRVVDSFEHARPIWWYLPVVVGMIFPWAFWWPMWRGMSRLREEADRGVRFLLAWLVPSLVALSMVSGKQFYYLVPWVAGAALLVARAVDEECARDARKAPARVPRSLIPFALLMVGAAGAWLLGGHGFAHGQTANKWYSGFVLAPLAYPLALGVLGLMLLFPSRRAGGAEISKLAPLTLLAAALGHAAFTATLWPYFDLAPAAAILSAAQQSGRVVATLDKYEGEYHFLGRLREPLVQLDDANAAAWVSEHPDGLVVTRPSTPNPLASRVPIYRARFRERELEIWNARDWLRP